MYHGCQVYCITGVRCIVSRVPGILYHVSGILYHVKPNKCRAPSLILGLYCSAGMVSILAIHINRGSRTFFLFVQTSSNKSKAAVTGEM